MTRNESLIKVSVCISIHNGQRFVERCINSVLSQSIKEIEIVVVDNGSTDTTLEILNTYKIKYPNIINVISQSDKGLAIGRQVGIDNAVGEYIAFLDVDDFVTQDAYKRMFEAAVIHDVDIVECFTLKGHSIVGSNYDGVRSTNDVLCDYFAKGEIPSMLWLRLFKRNLFVEKVMPNLYVNNEDIFAFPLLLHRAKSIFYLKEPLHVYSIDNDESVMNLVKGFEGEKILENRIKTLEVIPFLVHNIGSDIIKKIYSQEFEFFKARTILNFSLARLGNLKVSERLKIATQVTGTPLNSLNPYFRELNHFNKWIQFSIRMFGVNSTIKLYLFFKYRKL